MASFPVRKLFKSLVKSHLPIFPFGVVLKETITQINVTKIFACFLLAPYNFGSHIYTVNEFWVDFCIWGEIRVWFPCPACGCSVPPTPVTKETSLPAVCSGHSGRRPVDGRSVGLLLGSLFCSADLCVCVSAGQAVWDRGQVMPPALFFSLKTFLLLLRDLSGYIWIFALFSLYQKHTTGIWVTITLNLQMTLGTMDIATMLVLAIHRDTEYLSICLCLWSVPYIIFRAHSFHPLGNTDS